ncbi:MAG TPA: hypothetical protein VLU54_16855 [Casimicrobiaceae bacterium]|nr:hypothetical protein [Casimicrobiaceae bacterium]
MTMPSAETSRRQIGECLLLPALAASLPWRVAWPLLRALARRGFFFADGAARAAQAAAQRGFAENPASWAYSHRLMRIVDQIDPAISSSRGDRWMESHLTVDGDPLPPGPCILVGFHYGTGFWSLRHLRRCGYRVSFLSRPIDASLAPGQPLRLAFMRWRMRQVEKAGGAPVIYVGGSVERIRAALRDGISILGMVDVPQPSSTSRAQVSFLGAIARFPDGLVRLAAAEKVPLVAYLARLDPQSGRRHLTLARLPIGGEDPMQSLVALLERAVRDDPSAWHLWEQWPLFIDTPPAR